MNKIIHDLRKYPYSGEDIMELLQNKTKILTYPDLMKYDNIDDVLYPYDNAVILYLTKPAFGHWTAIMKRGDTIEFFDPYGHFPDDILKKLDPKIKKKLGQNYPKLSELLYNSDQNYKIVYNDTQLQEYNKNISNCGRHVGLRLALKDYPLEEYIKFITSGPLSPDDNVTYFTALV